MSDVFRGPLAIQRQHLQLPLDRHRRRQKANLTVAGLIFEFSCNRDCFSVGGQRTAEIRCAGYLQILGYTEFALEHRDALIDRRQNRILERGYIAGSICNDGIASMTRLIGL